MRSPLWALLALVLAAAPAAQPAKGILSGRLTFADSGDAAAGVNLTLAGRRGNSVGAAVTDGEGRYSITALPGVYGLSVRLPGQQLRYLAGRLGAEGTLEEGRLVRIRSGGETAFDYSLLPAGGIGGEVRSPDGTPVRDAMVSVFAVPEDNHGTLLLTEGTAATDAEGHFHVSGLAPGTYRIRAIPPNGIPPDDEGRIWLPTYYPGIPSPANAIGVAAGAGDQFDALTLTFVRGRPFVVSGRVSDGQTPAVGGRRVQLLEGNGRRMSYRAVTTDQAGSFIFKNVPPGRYDVAAITASGAAFVSALDVERDVLDLWLDVRPKVQLTGQVSSTRGQRIPQGLTVVARSGDPFGSVRSAVESDNHFTIDVMGPITLGVEGLPKGWRLLSVANGRIDLLDTSVASDTIDAPLTLVVSQQTASVTGTLLEGSDTMAVVLVAEDRRRWTPGSSGLVLAEPDADGRFSATGLPPGRYYAAAAARIPHAFFAGEPSTITAVIAGAAPVDLQAGANALAVRAERR